MFFFLFYGVEILGPNDQNWSKKEVGFYDDEPLSKNYLSILVKGILSLDKHFVLFEIEIFSFHLFLERLWTIYVLICELFFIHWLRAVFRSGYWFHKIVLLNSLWLILAFLAFWLKTIFLGLVTWEALFFRLFFGRSNTVIWFLKNNFFWRFNLLHVCFLLILQKFSSSITRADSLFTSTFKHSCFARHLYVDHTLEISFMNNCLVLNNLWVVKKTVGVASFNVYLFLCS